MRVPCISDCSSQTENTDDRCQFADDYLTLQAIRDQDFRRGRS